jgi:hypothetical protein
MKRLLISLILALLLLAGCAAYQDSTRQRFELLSQQYSQFDVKIAWETRVAEGKTVVDGIVKNVRYAYMYDLEIWVATLDKKGEPVAREVAYVIPRQIKLDSSTHFTVKLPVAAAPGSKLRFTYRYRGSDGGEGFNSNSGLNWTHSFETVVQ